MFETLVDGFSKEYSDRCASILHAFNMWSNLVIKCVAHELIYSSFFHCFCVVLGAHEKQCVLCRTHCFSLMPHPF